MRHGLVTLSKLVVSGAGWHPFALRAAPNLWAASPTSWKDCHWTSPKCLTLGVFQPKNSRSPTHRRSGKLLNDKATKSYRDMAPLWGVSAKLFLNLASTRCASSFSTGTDRMGSGVTSLMTAGTHPKVNNVI